MEESLLPKSEQITTEYITRRGVRNLSGDVAGIVQMDRYFRREEWIEVEGG